MTQESVFALELVALGFGLVLLAAAALHDVAVRTIPNALPLLLAIDGTILRVLKGDIAWGSPQAAQSSFWLPCVGAAA
ncbi:hypothetical protein ACFQU2_38000 [Siccirubricoccus deserti]